jgi:hypothetical protein
MQADMSFGSGGDYNEENEDPIDGSGDGSGDYRSKCYVVVCMISQSMIYDFLNQPLVFPFF